jgi:CheY-like chemotaxis protein
LKLPFGVELSLAGQELDRAAEETEREAREREQTTADVRSILDYIVTPEQRSQVLRRVQAVLPALQPGAQILWVDDHPENNTNERRMLQALRIFVDEARSTDQAMALLERAHYDLVISDMERNGNKEAGIELLSKMREIDTTVILYVGLKDPSKGAPPGAFALCVRPDELLHYILDVLERRRM